MNTRISPKTGRVRKRTARPRLSLTDHLANLHLLLRSSSFQRWPLNLTFFAEDVHRVWQKWCAMHIVEKIRPGIAVTVDKSALNQAIPAGTTRLAPAPTAVGINALDVGYSTLKPQLEKVQEVFGNRHARDCAICSKKVAVSGAASLVCPKEGCKAVSHLSCLSAAFLKTERTKGAIIPTGGTCPGCKTELRWVDLVKDLSLRMRGEKEVKALFKPKRGKKATAVADPDDDMDSSADEDDALEMVLLGRQGDWKELLDSSDDDFDFRRTRSDPSPGRDMKVFKTGNTALAYSEPVIEDSDWENAEIIT